MNAADPAANSRLQIENLKSLFLGWAGVVLGLWYADQTMQCILGLVRMKKFGWWDSYDATLHLAIALYFALKGIGKLRHSNQARVRSGFGWGKLLIGLILIYATLKPHFVPAHSLLGTENANSSFDGVAMLIYIIAAAFILAAFVDKGKNVRGIEKSEKPSTIVDLT